MDIMVVANVFNSHLLCLLKIEWHIESPLTVPEDQTDNGDRLTTVYSDQRLFLVSVNFLKSCIGSVGAFVHLHDSE